MDVWFGRNNLALTVFVPFDCANNCRFCTSKALYSNSDTSVESVEYQMRRVLNEFRYPIRDIVFTGGEPTWNLESLKSMIRLIPHWKNVYINTTLPNKNLDAFIELVNTTDCIQGVNVSRHGASYEEDSKMLNDIAPDEAMERFSVPVRINCVVGAQNVEAVLERWRGRGVEVCFRKDYTKETPEELHNPYEPFMVHLSEMGFRFVSHTQCNVCDTTRFEFDGLKVVYHKGLERSSIYHADSDSLEVNDLIILPDGRFSYDWSGIKLSRLYEMEKQYNRPYDRPYARTIIDNCDSHCGGGGCGGIWYGGYMSSGCGGGRGCG